MGIADVTINSNFKNWTPTIITKSELENISKNYLNDSMRLQITEKGLETIKKTTPNLVRKIGLNNGNLESYKININEIPINKLSSYKDFISEEYQPLIPLIPILLKNIFEITIDSFSPNLMLNDLSYKFDLSQLNLNLIPGGNPNELVFDLEIEVSKIDLSLNLAKLEIVTKSSTKKINPLKLGRFDLKNLKTTIATKNPLKLKARVLINKTQNENIKLSFQSLETNISKTDYKFEFKNLDWTQLYNNPQEKQAKNVKQPREQKKIEDAAFASFNKLAQEFVSSRLTIIINKLSDSIKKGEFSETLNTIASEISNQYTEVGTNFPEIFSKSNNHNSTESSHSNDVLVGLNLNTMNFSKKSSGSNSIFFYFDSFLEGHSNKKYSDPIITEDNNKENALSNFISNSEENDSNKNDATLLVSTDLIRRYFQINFENDAFTNLNFKDFKFSITLKDNPKLKILSPHEYNSYGIQRAGKNSLYILAESLVEVDLRNYDFIPIFIEKAVTKGTVLISLDYVGRNSFQLFLHKILQAELISADGEAPSFIKTTAFNRAISFANERIYLKNPLDLVTTLSLAHDDKKSFQLLPLSILDMPILISSISPSIETSELIKIDLSFEK